MFWRRIAFDAAQFTTEWLKLVFGGVIIFAIVELLLDRNRALNNRVNLNRVFASEVIAPLRDADIAAAAIRVSVSGDASTDAVSELTRMGGTLERAAAALNHLVSTAFDASHAAAISALGGAFNSYDWREALRELKVAKPWRAANVAELERLALHIGEVAKNAADLENQLT